MSEFPPSRTTPPEPCGSPTASKLAARAAERQPVVIVTIDGPGGTGKSTVSRVVAQRSGLPHLDTGAYYRAATLAIIEAGAAPTDEEKVTEIVSRARFAQESGRTYLDGRDVSEEIRGEAVTAAVSAVAAHVLVRRQLVEEQRAWVERHAGSGVIEGRDIGSVVFPDADLKIYLDASPEVRARRRAHETGEDYDAVLADLNRRDRHDSTRPASPLTIPDGAVVVDTSKLSFQEVVERVLGLIPSKS